MITILLIFLIIVIPGLALLVLFKSKQIDEEALWISPWLGIVFILSIIVSSGLANIPLSTTAVYAVVPSILIILIFALILKSIPTFRFSSEFKSSILFFIASLVIFNFLPIKEIGKDSVDAFYRNKTIISKLSMAQEFKITDYTVGDEMITWWVSNIFHTSPENAQIYITMLCLSLLFLLILTIVHKLFSTQNFFDIIIFFWFHIFIQILIQNGLITIQSVLATGIILTLILLSLSYKEQFKESDVSLIRGEEFLIALCISVLIILEATFAKIIFVILFGLVMYFVTDKHLRKSLIPLRIFLLSVLINPVIFGFLIHIQ